MAEAETPASNVVQEPFFADRGQAICIRKAAKMARWGGYYFFIWPLIITILMVVSFMVVMPGALPFVLLVALLINGYLAHRYLERNTEPAKVFELTRDKASLYILEDPPKPITTVSLNRDTTVDVVLNDATTSKEYGKLFGWSFEDGNGSIRVSAYEDWELWDIQALRDPVYKVIEHNDMKRGETLRYYKEGLKGVIPLRSRGALDPPPEPPPTI